VPASRIKALPHPADGTIAEAQQLRRVLAGALPKRLVLVTSKSATRRAGFIFRRILRGEEVAVFCHPSPYDSFQADRWWSRPKNALTVVTEYEKFLVNGVTLLFSLPETP
jgi:uncharacterized SAM-binding protein YcdF (DUF218 family)